MKHYQAMGVVMHKLLRIIYGVLKTKTKFDAAIDQKNMEQAEEKQKQNQQKIKESKEIKQQKKHRYQSATPQDESISRRAAQKRKKQAASQAS